MQSLGCAMSGGMVSVAQPAMVRTSAMERVLAPLSSQLYRLVLLYERGEEETGEEETGEEDELFSLLEAAAQAVSMATRNMAAEASRQAVKSDDDVMRVEMLSQLEPITVSGQHVLLAVQRLSIQPWLAEHREELINATQSVLLAVLQVLQIEDDSCVRMVVSAAEGVLESLRAVGSCRDMTSLLRSFQSFSERLLRLRGLVQGRAATLQDAGLAEQLHYCLDTLRKCISMLHTAMVTTITHPNSLQAQEARSYILEKVEITICDIITMLRSKGPSGTPRSCGFYTEKRDRLLQLLALPATSSPPPSSHQALDSLMRDLVFHCMQVVCGSRRASQQKVVDHCRHVLQLWADQAQLLRTVRLPQAPQDDENKEDEGMSWQQVESISRALTQQVLQLDDALMTALLYQVLDNFVEAANVCEYLMDAANIVKDRESPLDESGEPAACYHLQTSLEDFLSQTDKIIQVAGFMSASAADAQSLENVMNSRACLHRLRRGLASLSLELDRQSEKSVETVQSLIGMCQRWTEESNQLQDALYDVIDVRQFINLAVAEMVIAQHGCDSAYEEQSTALFSKHVRRLAAHLGQVLCCVRRHVDRSDSPIYRNGLLVLLRQAEASQTRLSGSITDLIFCLNMEAFSSFSQDVSMVIHQVKVLREGLDGQQHPHLLSPLRVGARAAHVAPEPGPDRQAPEHAWRVDSTGFHPSALEKDNSRGSLAEEDFEEIAQSPPPKHNKTDCKVPVVDPNHNPKQISTKPSDVNLLPLLCEVVTVTRQKDVSILNRTCACVLELSNCYTQAAKEALVLVTAVDGHTLGALRVELLSLTPLLVQTAQETAMSTSRSTSRLYRHSIMFSDLINSMRKVLLPAAEPWYHIITCTLHTSAPSVALQLGEVMSLCADAVQFLTASDIPVRANCQESFTRLHSKLNKAHNHSRYLAEQVASQTCQPDLLEGLGLLWALSLHVLLDSFDKILESPGRRDMEPLTPQKRLAAMSENSLRVQEAARLTCLNCKNSYKVKVLSELQDELKVLTETYLQGEVERKGSSGVIDLARSEILHRQLLIRLRVMALHLNKHNREYVTGIQHVIDLAYSVELCHRDDEQLQEAEQQFEKAAELLLQNIKSANEILQDCFNYIRDPRTRSSLRAFSDHLSFQISDVLSRARLVKESHCVCETLNLHILVQCWAAKARYVAEEIWKLDGIQSWVKDQVKTSLQGIRPCRNSPRVGVKTKAVPLVREDTHTLNKKAVITQVVHSPEIMETVQTVEVDVYTPVPKHEFAVETQQDVDRSGLNAGSGVSSFTSTSLFLKQETGRWDANGNRIVQVTRDMADKIYHMAQYLRRKGPILNKEVFVETARAVVDDCQSVTQFVRVIANHCLDLQSSTELSLILEQILTITSQLSIISSVNALTPSSKSSDEILVKNAQNLLQTILQGLHAAETACIKQGLMQPVPGSDGAEAAALCFQWKRNLQLHRAQQQASPHTDDLGLRRTASHPGPPSLAPSLAL